MKVVERWDFSRIVVQNDGSVEGKLDCDLTLEQVDELISKLQAAAALYKEIEKSYQKYMEEER